MSNNKSIIPSFFDEWTGFFDELQEVLVFGGPFVNIKIRINSIWGKIERKPDLFCWFPKSKKNSDIITILCAWSLRMNFVCLHLLLFLISQRVLPQEKYSAKRFPLSEQILVGKTYLNRIVPPAIISTECNWSKFDGLTRQVTDWIRRFIKIRRSFFLAKDERALRLVIWVRLNAG
jgi:hypothetical protein